MGFKEMFDNRLADAQRILKTAEMQHRKLTAKERVEVEQLITEALHWKGKIADGEQFEKDRAEFFASGQYQAELRKLGLGDGTPTFNNPQARSFGGSLWNAAKMAGVQPVPGQVVRTQLTFDAESTKALITAGQADDILAERDDGLTAMPDTRQYLFPAIGVQNVDSETGKIEYVRQSVRTLASPADVTMSFASTATKPVTVTTVELKSEEPHMFATTSELIPNAYFARDDLRQLVDDNLQMALRVALDQHVAQSIAFGATSSSTGADILEKIVRAMQVIRDDGFEPRVVALSSSDLTTLTLLKASGSGEYLLQDRPALPPLRVSSGVTTGQPLVIDTQAIGTLFLGNLNVDADAFEAFRSNQTRLRAEFPGLMVVKQLKAAVRVT